MLAASLIVPTKNRAAMLARFLPSLAEQSVDEAYEIIVVDNGSTDSTAKVVEEASARWPHVRRIVEEKPGSAHACHSGATAARSPILLFLDDDMLAVPELAAHHLQAHRENPRSCVLGHVLSAPGRHPFERMMAYIFDGPRQSLAHRQPAPSDYWSGNVSLARDLYFQLGGYNKTFAEIGYGKDHDFGNRLVAAGVKLVFAPAALTYHHFTERFGDRLDKSYRVGVACAYIKEHHPNFPMEKNLTTRGSWYAGAVVWLCRVAAGVMEPVTHGEGLPFAPLRFVYDLGLRTATRRGVRDYEDRRVGSLDKMPSCPTVGPNE